MRVYCQRGHKKQKMTLSKQHSISINSYTTKVQVAEKWNLQLMGIQVHYKAGFNKSEHTSNGHECIIVNTFLFLLCE